jgi:tetratricopeptide (TPR) repeat protein
LGYIGSTTTSLARRNLAESLFRRGKYAAAERELRAVLESRPQDVDAQLWLAQTLARTGRSPEALRIYERAMSLPGAAEDALVEATELATTGGELETARRMIGAAPAGSSVVHTARGIVAETNADAPAAEREYRQALALEPTSFDAAARLSDLLKNVGRTRDALAAVERALSLAPDSPRLLGLAGDARLSVGDVAGAERAFVRALELAPDADTLRIALGRTRLAAKQPVRAIDALSRAAASPDRDTLLGAAYAATQDWRKAVEHLQAALNAGRSTPEILNSLGWAHLQLGDRSAAASFFNRSLAAKPAQPEIRRLLRDLSASRDDHRRSMP